MQGIKMRRAVSSRETAAIIAECAQHRKPKHIARRFNVQIKTVYKIAHDNQVSRQAFCETAKRELRELLRTGGRRQPSKRYRTLLIGAGGQPVKELADEWHVSTRAIWRWLLQIKTEARHGLPKLGG